MKVIERASTSHELQPFVSEWFSNGTLSDLREELPDELVVECSANMQYIHQYFFIREYAYRNDLEVKQFSGEEDELDRRSYQLIARRGHFCIGGSRLTITTPNQPVKLPLERGDYSILDQLPFLAEAPYCELGRTAVLPQFRDSNPLREIFKLAIEISKQRGCRYMIGVSPPKVARLFQRIFKQIGYVDEIRPEIPAPMGAENNHLNLVFQLVYLEN